MRGGRLIVIVGVFIGIIAGVLVILMMSRGTTTTVASPTPQPVTVVRAAQNIAKGTVIGLDAIQLVQLEGGQPAPASAVKDPVLVAGMTAAMDIPQGTIIQKEMFFDRDEMAQEGQNASTLFQPGRVAMALPIGDLSGVAGAITAGDHVDIIASFEFADVDTELQALLPLDGSVEQLSRTETQLALQNLEVLRVGMWGTGPSSEGSGGKSTATADILTLLLPQQDALVLQWLLVKFEQEQAEFTLVLRAQEDDEIVSTDPATLDYIMKRFNIVVPPKPSVTTRQLETSGNIGPR